MRPRSPVHTDIILLGAGHAHVEVLRRFAKRPEAGVRLTLIGREPETPYSGMLPGLIRGEYTHAQAHIDLGPLAAAAGARLILGEAEAILLDDRAVIVPGRPPISYDFLSINVNPSWPAIGHSAPPTAGDPRIEVQAIQATLAQLQARLQALDAKLAAEAKPAPPVKK